MSCSGAWTRPSTRYGRPQAPYEMTGPFSRTTMGNCGSIRRARAAALRPAATPPMTTNAIGALLLFVHFLDKIQDIEGLDFAVRVVAANGVLLVGEDLEDGGELSHHEQLD